MVWQYICVGGATVTAAAAAAADVQSGVLGCFRKEHHRGMAVRVALCMLIMSVTPTPQLFGLLSRNHHLATAPQSSRHTTTTPLLPLPGVFKMLDAAGAVLVQSASAPVLDPAGNGSITTTIVNNTGTGHRLAAVPRQRPVRPALEGRRHASLVGHTRPP